MIEAAKLRVLLLNDQPAASHLGSSKTWEEKSGSAISQGTPLLSKASKRITRCARAEARFEQRRQLGPIRGPGGCVDESWILGERSLSERVHRPDPVLFAEGGDAHPAVGRLVEAVEGREAELHPVQVRSGRCFAIGPDRCHGRDKQARIQNGCVDALRFPGAFAMVERLNDPDGREEPVAGVTQGRETPEGLPAVAAPAVLVGHPGQRAAGLVVTRVSRTGGRGRSPRVWQ